MRYALTRRRALARTKADQVPEPDLSGWLVATHAALARRPAAYPGVLASSARTGSGIAELRTSIVQI